jgi:hypothetical protein
MKFIAHRGNINGPNELLENKPSYIRHALNKGYDVEIDVWLSDDGKFFLGHNNPQYFIEEDFLLKKGLWIHTKNINAMSVLGHRTNCFFHNTDDAVFTSNGFIWIYPGKQIPKEGKSVVVLKGSHSYSGEELKRCYAICSDNIDDLK